MTDYFALFSIAPAVDVDANALRKTFYQLSRQVHPDFTASRTGDVSLEASAQLNVAYATLLDEDKRIAHLVQLYCPQKSIPAPSPDFLMDMLEWNEQIQECISTEDPAARLAQQEQLRARLEGLRQQMGADMRQQYRHVDFVQAHEAVFDGLLDYICKRKYISRLVEQLCP